MMLDVVDISLQAVDMCNKSSNTAREHYNFVICCSPENEKGTLQAIFEEELPATAAINYIVDQGASFDEHLNDAYHQLFQQGYDSVVCIGGDMPTILPEFLQRAFQWLHYLGAESAQGAIVIAPCQAAGVSLIGLTSNAPMDFSGVFYNLQGTSALEAITNIAYTKRMRWHARNYSRCGFAGRPSPYYSYYQCDVLCQHFSGTHHHSKIYFWIGYSKMAWLCVHTTQ